MMAVEMKYVLDIAIIKGGYSEHINSKYKSVFQTNTYKGYSYLNQKS